jgi:glycosyltransferase involved in cell wall biosynthesis
LKVKIVDGVKLSIIIPAYNEEKLLPQCLKSIFAARLPESHEIIVVNNASVDRTEEVARSFSDVRVVNESARGANRARQAGFLASSGEILVYFDADTVIPADWFSNVLEIFKKDPKLIGATGPYHYGKISKIAGLLVWLYDHVIIPGFEWIWQHIFRQGGVMLIGGNFAVKRTALLAIGGFDTKIDFFGDDIDLTRRLAKVGKIRFINKLSVYSSPRRFEKEGAIRTSFKYIINFFSEWIFKRPVHGGHKDIR